MQLMSVDGDGDGDCGMMFFLTCMPNNGAVHHHVPRYAKVAASYRIRILLHPLGQDFWRHHRFLAYTKDLLALRSIKTI
jgi:hypothetical protein